MDLIFYPAREEIPLCPLRIFPVEWSPRGYKRSLFTIPEWFSSSNSTK